MRKVKKLINRLLAIRLVRKVYNGVNKLVLWLGASSRLSSTLYYTLALLTFNREQFAVLSGRKRYYQNLKKVRTNYVELRRNTHRLEKGMIMRPQRPVFALGYIEETVDFYKQATSDHDDDSAVDSDELAWAHNVLHQYFLISESNDKRLKRAKAKFESVVYKTSETRKIPFERGTPNSNIRYEDLVDLSMQRRSVRWFKQKPVPRSLIDKAMLVARQAPTACNRLPYEFKVFDDPRMVKKVAGIPFGAAGYSHNIPTVIVIVGKLDSYFSPRDRHVVYIDGALAAMSFMLALETLGLASSPINWPDFEPLERKMQKTLGLRVDERPIMLLAVGYGDPEGMIPFSQKKALDSIRSYNDMGETP